MKYIIKPIKIEDARAVSKWVYENEYSIYSMDESRETLDELMYGSYYSVTDGEGLIGYFCFGKSAQVPAGNEYGAYEDLGYMDIGLGLKPDLCGKGLGLDFIVFGIEFAEKEFGADRFRLTVAGFNRRAIKVYERAGFVGVSSFVRKFDGVKFEVMVIG